MPARALTPQSVGHDSGATVASVDRFTLRYTRNGRHWDVPIEPLDTYYLRLQPGPTWSDGTPLSAAEGQQAQRDLDATLRLWGIPYEFVLPGDPRILRGLDELSDYLRAASMSSGS